MAEIYKIFGLAVIAITVTAVLKNRGSAVSPYIPQLTAVVILITAVTALMPVIKYIKELASGKNVDADTIYILLTAAVIAFIGSVISDICKENGENMLKNAVEFATNAEIMLLALPLIKALVSKASGILKL